MKAVLQRVNEANVRVDGEVVGAIGPGILLLLGVEKGDSETDSDWLLRKSIELRIFADVTGKMNRSLLETGGGLLVVSQFTIAGNCTKGRRPSFDTAAPPSEGQRLYDFFVSRARAFGLPVATGIFQADMQVALVNDGPVTFILDSRKGA